MKTNRLKYEIKQHKLNCTEIAEMVGLSKPALSRRLHAVTPWQFSQVVMIAQILEIPPEQWTEVFGLDER